MNNTRNEIKAQIIRAGFTMQEVCDRLHDDYGRSDSVSNLSNKLQRESIRYREGVMPEYDDMYAQFDRSLPEALAEAEKSADAFGKAFAEKHKDDKLHYFVGSGALYGATYSYAMCYWEEMHWMRTKSIHAAEFFHGMLEIIDEDTPVTVLMGEDAQRPLCERVVRFLKKVNRNYTVIDSKKLCAARHQR